MKLEKILDRLGSLEKNSFIKIIDSIIANNPANKKEIEKILSSTDKGLKAVDSQNIAKIFSLTQNEFLSHLKEEFQDTSSQLDILIDIIIRDGNCLMQQDWLSRLYEKELKSLKEKIKLFAKDIENEKSEISEERKRDYTIYKACLQTAYINDEQVNREAKITWDELSILLTLSDELDLSQEEIKLINYMILPIKMWDVQEVINSLKNIGVIFFSRKENTIYVADEMVRLLRKLRGKTVGDKFFRRTLKLLREPIINQIAKRHNVNKALSYEDKIEGIIKEGVSFATLMKRDIYKKDSTLTEKKSTLNELCEKGLGIPNLKGSVLEEKIENLITHFDQIEKDEKVGISLDGYEKLLSDLNNQFPKFNKTIRDKFELQNEFVLEASFLLDYNIKPRDILDLIDKANLSAFIKENGIKQRGDDILNALEHYKDSENLFLENYENVGFRNLNLLKENGINLKEAEIGLKFEELTKFIFEKMGLNVDENLKNKLNTKKDKIDIVLNVGDNQIIIVECKSVKESGYNKFSTVSRQLKAYHSLAQKNNFIVNKVLLIAPEFTDDFVTDCEMDTEINLSLITAGTLLRILEVFKTSKYEVFPLLLFRDVFINEERILKALSK
jgi:hypothetical protein